MPYLIMFMVFAKVALKSAMYSTTPMTETNKTLNVTSNFCTENNACCSKHAAQCLRKRKESTIVSHHMSSHGHAHTHVLTTFFCNKLTLHACQGTFRFVCPSPKNLWRDQKAQIRSRPPWRIRHPLNLC